VSFSLSELVAPHFVAKITENGKETVQTAEFSETAEGTGRMLKSQVEEGTVYSKSPWYQILGVDAGAPLLGSQVWGICRDANLTLQRKSSCLGRFGE
jgi:hypothetical protein